MPHPLTEIHGSWTIFTEFGEICHLASIHKGYGSNFEKCYKVGLTPSLKFMAIKPSLLNLGNLSSSFSQCLVAWLWWQEELVFSIKAIIQELLSTKNPSKARTQEKSQEEMNFGGSWKYLHHTFGSMKKNFSNFGHLSRLSYHGRKHLHTIFTIEILIKILVASICMIEFIL